MYQWPSAYVPQEEFRRILELAPAGVFYAGCFGGSGMNGLGCQYHLYLGAGFPDGSLGPEAGYFFGR